jgi:hypothetical protein
MAAGAHVRSDSTTYAFFGFTLSSNFPFSRHLLRGEGRPDLTFSWLESPPPYLHADRSRPDYNLSCRIEGRVCTVSGFSDAACESLRFSSIADFFLWPDRIVGCPAPGSDIRVAEAVFLGSIAGLWLERRGISPLHGAAVEVGASAVAFLGPKGSGKTTLAAEFLRRGHPLLSDDILAVRSEPESFEIQPALPEIRMWPEQVKEFVASQVPQVPRSKVYLPVGGAGGYGSFCPEPRRLVRVYLPRRTDGTEGTSVPTLKEIHGRDAVRQLLGNMLLPRIADAAGLAAGRLDVLTRLVEQVPVRRLVYPSGMQRLQQVADAVAADIRRDRAEPQ